MEINQLGKGARNLVYSLKATSFRKRGFPKTLPRTVWIAVTYKCNSKCKMCSIWKRYRDAPELIKKEMTLKEFFDFVEKNRFLKDIALSGGEPFLQPDLEKMFIYLDKKGYPTGTATNGILADHVISTEENLLSKLSGKNLHSLEVSIDGLEKEHDRVRGVTGLFEKALKIVKWGLATQKKFPFFSINVSHTITSHNYQDLLKFVDFFVELGLKPNQISFRTAQISESFYGNENSKEVPKNIQGLIKEISRVLEKYPYYRKDWFYKNMLNYLKSPSKFRIPCYAAITFAYIDPYWDVYPCINWPKPIGNLRDFDLSLEKLWKSKSAVEIRKLIRAGKCPNCWTGCSTVPSRVSNFKLLAQNYLNLLFSREK